LRSTFQQITAHCESDCPMQIVKCPLFELGMCHEKCTGSLIRSSLAQHVGKQVKKFKECEHSQAELQRKYDELKCEFELLKETHNQHKSTTTTTIVDLTGGLTLQGNESKELERLPSVSTMQTPALDFTKDGEHAEPDSVPCSAASTAGPATVIYKYMSLPWRKFITVFADHLRGMMSPTNPSVNLQCTRTTLSKKY
jgi:hypothetical protein